MLHEELTGKIISAFYKVYNTLGHGFLEKVYENALALELKHQYLQVQQQRKIDVFYGNIKVGEYYADVIVNDLVVLELKAADGIVPEHEAQLLNYLKATQIEVGLLLNFGPKPQFIRRIFTNDKKINREYHN